MDEFLTEKSGSWYTVLISVFRIYSSDECRRIWFGNGISDDLGNGRDVVKLFFEEREEVMGENSK